MPAQLDVDREAVKAHALTHGVREAARAFGLKEATVMQWSAREQWLKGAGQAVIVQEMPKSIRPQAVSGVSKPSEAALNTLQRLGSKTKLVQAKAVLKGSSALGRMPGEAIAARASDLKALVDAGAKLHGSAEQGTSLLGISVTVHDPDQVMQVIDVEATTISTDIP